MNYLKKPEMITFMAMALMIGSLTTVFSFPQLILFAVVFGLYTGNLMLTIKKITAK